MAASFSPFSEMDDSRERPPGEVETGISAVNENSKFINECFLHLSPSPSSHWLIIPLSTPMDLESLPEWSGHPNDEGTMARAADGREVHSNSCAGGNMWDGYWKMGFFFGSNL